MPKLTAMVSLYNSGEWLDNRLQNLLASTYVADMEIICLNSASPDPRDAQIAQQYAERHPVVKYVESEYCNVYASWNKILRMSDSDYVTNANADDIVSPDCYTKLIAALEHVGPEYGFTYPSWLVTHVPNQTWPPCVGVDYTGGKPGHYMGDVERAGVGHFPLWRRKLHTQLGMFDERFRALGDADWWARCYHRGKTKFLWYDAPLACYLWRGNQPAALQNLWHRMITAEEWGIYHSNVQQYSNV